VQPRMAANGPSIAVRVPAKINLFLAIRGRYPDGYHELSTVLQTVSLFDEVQVGVTGPQGRGHHPAARRHMLVELVTDAVDGLPDPAQNLAVRAAYALGAATGVTATDDVDAVDTTPRTLIRLRKDIPIAAGMAGGSADAAGSLVALNELWGTDLDREALRDLGAGLGSDVPFCVIGGTALATGRGTALARVLCRGTFHWVICQARERLSTGEVYAAWDDHGVPSEVEPDAVLAALRNRDAVALGAALHNDLQSPAFSLQPALASHREALLNAGALGAVVSGSGPTLLALAQDAAAATRIADAVGDRFQRVVVAQSPAGGPEARPC
jgi:4-diphosphocytidyl-2-C-methyl-D-erythritol kinase